MLSRHTPPLRGVGSFSHRPNYLFLGPLQKNQQKKNQRRLDLAFHLLEQVRERDESGGSGDLRQMTSCRLYLYTEQPRAYFHSFEGGEVQWFGTRFHYLVKDELDSLTLLLPLPKFWDYSFVDHALLPSKCFVN